MFLIIEPLEQWKFDEYITKAVYNRQIWVNIHYF
jgi:hypothetical protein